MTTRVGGAQTAAAYVSAKAVQRIYHGADLVENFASEPPVGAITVGSFGTLGLNGGNSRSYTFAPGNLVVDANPALVLIAVWVVNAFGLTTDLSTNPQLFTLNGVSSDTLLMRYIHNVAAGSKYVQASVGVWNSPSSGPVAFATTSSPFVYCSACGIYFLNLRGLHASPLGNLVREQVGTGTVLPFQLTTTAANSLVLAVNGCRNGTRGPFAFDDAGFTSLGELIGSGTGNGSFDVGFRNGLPSGVAIDCGGAWANGDGDRIAGAAFELRSAT